MKSTHALTLSAASLTTPVLHMARPQIIYEGWVLKKRRKKMQGFARRYFTLYESGLLSYSFEPGQPIRDQIHLQNAAISTSPGRKDVHIDSNTATFHIKCLSTEDFNQWMAAIRKFISSAGVEARRLSTQRQASRKSSLNLNLSRSGLLLEEMGASFDELGHAISALQVDLNPPKTPSLNKKQAHSKESMFGLFKKPHHAGVQVPHEPNQQSLTLPNSTRSGSESLREVRERFDALRAQYVSLVKIMQESINESSQQASLPMTTEEDEDLYQSPLHTPSATLSRSGLRDSVTSASDSVVEWFDAVDEGPQEFVVEMGQDVSEPGSRMLSGSSETSSVDTDFEECEPALSTTLESPSARSMAVSRRTRLPCPPPSDEGSLFAILKKNVGKDLSTITFPVTFNEPLTMLQRAAEEVEYYNLLDEAARATDPVTRMSYVAAFAVSGYAHTRHRTGRKGFNPMLAETFEDVRMKFIAEKVRHNPLEIAYHAEGENWELTVTSCGKTKFWGKSLEIIPLGTNRLKIGEETFIWKKPSSFMRNLMVGTKYFEHCGNMTIENLATKYRCVVDFKQNGYWGPTNVVSAAIHDSNGTTVGQLDGKWDDQISQMLEASHFHLLWKMSPFPKDAPESYGFTYYGITLNEVTSDIEKRLPPTDSRLRLDVRALENGQLDLAEDEKLRIEGLQRERRANGAERQPRWFKQVGDEWHYAGGYWENRASGWKNSPVKPLW
ncbi:hypothetical protein CPC08DRAFT_701646 [Agrocybe pediades]|nr:hypothetical protein CPC08DRAFT_701646 [Agrocybe pediades]